MGPHEAGPVRDDRRQGLRVQHPGDTAGAEGDVPALPAAEPGGTSGCPPEQQRAPAVPDPAERMDGERDLVGDARRDARIAAGQFLQGTDPDEPVVADRVLARAVHGVGGPPPRREGVDRYAAQRDQAQCGFLRIQQVDAAEAGTGAAHRRRQALAQRIVRTRTPTGPGHAAQHLTPISRR